MNFTDVPLKGNDKIRPLLWGSCPLEQVRLHRLEGTPLLDETQLAQVQERWRRAQATGTRLESRPLYRVERWNTETGLDLFCSRTDYRELMGVSYFFPEWGLASRALTFSCALWCPQGVILERRSLEVAECPGMVHLAPAGHPHPPQSLVEAVWEECEEELGLRPGEVSSIECLGLTAILQNNTFGLVCRAQTEVAFEEIKNRPRSGSWEQDSLLCLDLRGGDLNLAVTDGARWVLSCAGRQRWGEKWFASQRLWPLNSLT